MLELDSIRRMANRHGFHEIQFNETSRVIAFETTPTTATPGPKCRINIYYTTGTVATCLDHPRSGKTQLFRRGQTLDDLDALFQNPRQHTGVGYFRTKSKQNWQPVDGQSRSTNWRREECDDARRWRFIQATQEGFCNETQANQIAALCKLWHQLRFSPPNGHGLMTEAEYLGSMPPAQFEALNAYVVEQTGSPITICEDCDEKGCKCTERVGSYCSLMAILMKVGKDLDGVVGIWNMPMHETQKPRVQWADDIGDQAGLINCPCPEGADFRQRHSTFLHKLERQFRSLPAGIRRELLVWFTSKHAHGFEPFLMKPAFDPEDGPMGPGNFPFVGYGSHFCSNAIMRAHHDYGEMAYPEGANCCNCHGI